MAKTLKEYRRLPGRGMRFEGSRIIAGRRSVSRLWLGSDHLLRVDRGGYTEEYKRFYFRDIQAVIVQRNGRRKAWNIFLSLLSALSLLLGFGIGGGAALGVCGGIAAFFGSIALVNSLLGPTCVSYLKTAVQTEQLYAWNRIRRVEKGMELVRARIQETQGTYTIEQVRAQWERAAEAPALAFAATTGRAVSSLAFQPAAPRPYKSKIHLITFIVMLGAGLAGGLQVFFNSTLTTTISSVLSFCVMALVVIALIKQYQTDLRPAVRRLTWSAAVLSAYDLMVGYAVMIYLSVQNPSSARDQSELIRRFGELSLLEHPWLLVLFATSVAATFAIAVPGLFFLRMPGAPEKAEPAPAAVPAEEPPVQTN